MNKTPRAVAHREEMLDDSWFDRPGRQLKRAAVLEALAAQQGGAEVVDAQFDTWFVSDASR